MDIGELNWFCIVVYYGELPVYREFPCPWLFPPHGHIFWDCRLKLSKTFACVVVALMILSLLDRKVPKVHDSLLHALKQGVRVYSVHYSVHYTIYRVQCMVSSVQCTLYLVYCIVYPLQCTLYSVHCTKDTVQCTLYSVQCKVYMGSLDTWGQDGGEQRGHWEGAPQPFSRFWN